MNREEVLNKVLSVIAEKSEIDVAKITEQTSFVKDLGLDSMKLVDSIVEVEEQFSVEIPDNRLFKIHTIGDLVDFLEEEA